MDRYQPSPPAVRDRESPLSYVNTFFNVNTPTSSQKSVPASVGRREGRGGEGGVHRETTCDSRHGARRNG